MPTYCRSWNNASRALWRVDGAVAGVYSVVKGDADTSTSDSLSASYRIGPGRGSMAFLVVRDGGTGRRLSAMFNT